MSTKQIPQPAATGPAQVFDSTADNNPTPNVSGIGGPGPPPQEVPMHTGASNTFDLTIHRQFIPTDTITWSTAMVKGTLMWYSAVHPNFSNPILNYLAGMYNTWGGGLEYNFKVAGTGFHAGALAIVRIPPNKHPKDFPTPASWGPFEYVVIDPKTLEVVSAHLIDQRPINFHYQPFNADNPNTFGGYVAMYCLLPLNTSSSGSQNIQVQVFCRPGPDFQFSQLITPNLPGSISETPERLVEVGFNSAFRTSYMADESSILTVLPRSVNQLTTGIFGCFDASSKPVFSYLPSTILDIHTYFSNRYRHNVVAWPAISSYANGQTHFDLSSFPCPPVVLQDANAGFVCTDLKNFKSFTYASPDFDILGASATSGRSAFTYIYPTQEKDFPIGPVSLTYISDPSKENKYKELADLPQAPSLNESIMVFQAGGASSMSTHGIQLLMVTGALRHWIPDSSRAMLLLLIDTRVDLPIAYVKFSYTGLMTTNASADKIIFELLYTRFVFDSFILKNDPIPEKREFRTNRALARL